MICAEMRKAYEEARFPVAQQSTCLEMNKLNTIHESTDLNDTFQSSISNYQEQCSKIQSSANNRIKQVPSNLLSQTNQSQIVTTIKSRLLYDPELLLLQSLKHYENHVTSVHERGLVLSGGQTKKLYLDYEVNRSKFRQVKWLVGELRIKIQDLLTDNNNETIMDEPGLEATTSGPSNVPKIYITRYPENESIMVETGCDYLVSKLEPCSRQISSRRLENENSHMSKRVAKGCLTSSDFNCDIEQEPSTSACDNIIKTKSNNDNNFRSNEYFSKSRRLSR